MSLERCRECGHRVSTRAKRCPECGIPRPAPSRGRPAFWAVLGLGLVAFGAGAAVRYYDLPLVPVEDAVPSTPGPRAVNAVFPPLTARVGRTSRDVLVTNDDDFAWKACVIDLNAGVRPGGYSQSVRSIEPGEQVARRIDGFLRGDTEAFDPDVAALRTVDVHCDTPSGRAHFNAVF